MLLFNVTVREHTYTGRFHNDVVEAGSCEEAPPQPQEQAVTRPLRLGPGGQRGRRLGYRHAPGTGLGREQSTARTRLDSVLT